MGTVFWSMMAMKSEYKAENVPEWLSTHPASDKRSEMFDHLLPKVCPKLLYSHWTETKQENFKSKTFLFIRGSNNRTCEIFQLASTVILSSLELFCVRILSLRWKHLSNGSLGRRFF
jgi:hypothetical protein